MTPQEAFRQADPAHHVAHLARAIGRGDRLEIEQRLLDDPVDRLLGIERAVGVLVDELDVLAELAQRLAPEGREIDAVDQDAAGRGLQETHDGAHRRGLARSRLADDGVGGAAPDLERHAVEGTEALRAAAGDRKVLRQPLDDDGEIALRRWVRRAADAAC